MPICMASDYWYDLCGKYDNVICINISWVGSIWFLWHILGASTMSLTYKTFVPILCNTIEISYESYGNGAFIHRFIKMLAASVEITKDWRG